MHGYHGRVHIIQSIRVKKLLPTVPYPGVTIRQPAHDLLDGKHALFSHSSWRPVRVVRFLLLASFLFLLVGRASTRFLHLRRRAALFLVVADGATLRQAIRALLALLPPRPVVAAIAHG